MKQSLKYHFPKLYEPISLTNFLRNNINGAKYIAHCEDGDKNELKKMTKEANTLILIGPEGDFSAQEIKMALHKNFKSVSLGTSRLRTETAGIVAVNTISINH